MVGLASSRFNQSLLGGHRFLGGHDAIFYLFPFTLLLISEPADLLTRGFVGFHGRRDHISFRFAQLPLGRRPLSEVREYAGAALPIETENFGAQAVQEGAI